VAIYVSAKNNALRNQFILFVLETYLLGTCQAFCCVVPSRVWSRCVLLLCCIILGCAVLRRFVLCGVLGYGTELEYIGLRWVELRCVAL
jgi:hypothetical protein